MLHRLISGFLPLALAASLLAWGLAQTGTGAIDPAWGAPGSAAPVFLRVAAAVPSASAAPVFPRAAVAPSPALGGQPPSSVMPHQDNQCSALVTAGPDFFCSVFGNTTRRCSAHCSGNQFCSTIQGPAPPGHGAGCSVLGRRNGVCSVLQPATPLNVGSQCSAVGAADTRVQCSVLSPSTRRQACSSQNPGTLLDFCSATASEPGIQTQCSVLGGGMQRRSLCSVGRAGGQKLCSSGAPSAECSIATFNLGVCTALAGAPLGSCSAQTANAHCSVIGGSPGILCRQP